MAIFNIPYAEFAQNPKISCPAGSHEVVIPVEREALLEPVLAGRLHEALVVLGERHQEDDASHVLEAVDPLAALGALCQSGQCVIRSNFSNAKWSGLDCTCGDH